jgi:hypothetical protein
MLVSGSLLSSNTIPDEERIEKKKKVEKADEIYHPLVRGEMVPV